MHKLIKQLFHSGNYFSSLMFLTIYIFLICLYKLLILEILILYMRTTNISTNLSLVFNFAKEKNFVFMGSHASSVFLFMTFRFDI